MKRYGKIIALLLVFFAAVAAALYIEGNVPKLVVQRLETDKLQEGESFRVLQLGDLHSKWFGKGNNRLFALVAKANPDAIVCTGDVVDSMADEDIFGYSSAFFEGVLSFGKPVFYVSGNHEPWHAWEKLQKQAEQQGVRVLANRNETVRTPVSEIAFCGIEDFNTKYYDINAALEGTDSRRYTILLSHTPMAAEQVPDGKADLILSGHTHGGQIGLPFVSDRLMREKDSKYKKGFYRIGKNLLYVDSGLGTTRIPLRFLNRSQMTLFEIRGTGSPKGRE